MITTKRAFRASALSAAVSLFALMGPGAAMAGATGIHNSGAVFVSGHFQTATQPACGVPSDDCITDQFSGDLPGRNELTTKDFTETPQIIKYHDQTVLSVSGGQFAGKQFSGNEHGTIFVTSGFFYSCAEFTDANGDSLVLHYTGMIDLANDHDSGQYHGSVNNPLDHCPPQN